MHSIIVLFLIGSGFLFAQQPGAADKKPAEKDKPMTSESKPQSGAHLLTPAICGKGVFLFSLGQQSLGRETFEIKCQPDGVYSGSGRTELKVPGVMLDINTSMD